MLTTVTIAVRCTAPVNVFGLNLLHEGIISGLHFSNCWVSRNQFWPVTLKFCIFA